MWPLTTNNLDAIDVALEHIITVTTTSTAALIPSLHPSKKITCPLQVSFSINASQSDGGAQDVLFPSAPPIQRSENF
jgi:hypothetical protein